MKKVAINTLGCRTNQLESSIIFDELTKNNFEIVDFSEVADIYIINTCTVTAKSDSTSRYLIRHAKRTNPEAKIIVTGCYAQIAPEEIKTIEGVSLVIGNTEKQSLVEKIINDDFSQDQESQVFVSDIMQENSFIDKKILSASGRTRANIKIQDGCNFRCSYCIVPYARGKSRSNSLSNILEHVKEITELGFKELVLTGIHIGQWGKDLIPKDSLENLIKELEKIDELKRFRLSSIDPAEFTDSFVETLINSKKFCRHLHISLQSGNEQVLKLMNRKYTVEHYSNLIITLNKNIPDIAIGSDIIVGFPGETDEFFEDTYENLKKLPISHMHIFKYSKREGTPAAKMPDQVSDLIKKQRSQKLSELAASKNFEFRKSLLDKEQEILVEYSRDKKTGLLKGLSDNFIPVLVDGSDNLKNNLIKVKIVKVSQDKTIGIECN